MVWTRGKSLGHLSMHGLDLMKLFTCFVPCCTAIVTLYTEADESCLSPRGAAAEVWGPKNLGERGSRLPRDFMDPQHQTTRQLHHRLRK